jgi:hypothetical protein
MNRPKDIITRLNRNATKQKEYRHIVRGGLYAYIDPESRRPIQKRIADIYFLRKYAGWTYRQLAEWFHISRQRAQQISSRPTSSRKLKFSICHPKKSCM